MKTSLLLPRGIGALFGAAMLVALTFQVSAQVVPAEVGGIEFDDLQSPNPGGTKNKSFKPKDWLEVEASLKIPAQNREQQETGFIDRVVVKWYVAMKEKVSGKVVLLTKDINHINVPVDEEVFTSVYLSPNTIKRLTGSDRAGKTSVEVVALEVLINGVLAGGETSKMKGQRWWESPNLARGDRFPLLNKMETPFKMYWWDRYAEIEEER